MATRAYPAAACATGLALFLVFCGPGGEIWTPDGDADADADADWEPDAGCPGGCDDGIACTVDECVDGRCRSIPDDRLCAGGRCLDGVGCVECVTREDCDDGIACTTDSCNGNRCSSVPDDRSCPEGLTCDPERGCIGCGAAEDCNDVNPCTVDRCVDGACINAPDDTLCPSTRPHCSLARGCVECEADGHCDDGFACNGVERCGEGGTCLAGTPLDCDDGVACTVDTCTEAGGGRCVNTPDDGACAPGSHCDAVVGCTTRETFYAHSSTVLYEIDLAPAVPTAREIGPFGTTITDIAEAPGGTLYAVSFTDFYRVDRTTGAATRVGALGVSSANGLTVAPDGTLYTATSSGGVLYRVDPTTGAATEVGPFGEGMTSSGDIVWGPFGAIYVPDPEGATDRLISVNPLTGAASPIGDIGSTQVYGLSFTGGRLLGLTGSGALLSLDVATGRGTLLHTFAVAWWGAS